MPDLAHPRTIRELAPHDRPVNRLLASGPEALGDAELLATLSGARSLEVCQHLLARFDGWAGLRRALAPELLAITGVTVPMVAQIHAACELHRRLVYADYGARVQIRTPTDAAPLVLAELAHLDQEHLITLVLDRKNRLITLHHVYVGTISVTMVRVGEVFKEAVRRNAAAVIVAHNHVYSDPTPSPNDILLTRNLVEAGKLLDIEIIDSLIVAGGQWFSLRDHGLGFVA